MATRMDTDEILSIGESVPVGRQLSTAGREAAAEGALLEAAKAAQSAPIESEEIGTPALMTEI
jgi:hypothetical protein